jgi:hypothetical protein
MVQRELTCVTLGVAVAVLEVQVQLVQQLEVLMAAVVALVITEVAVQSVSSGPVQVQAVWPVHSHQQTQVICK